MASRRASSSRVGPAEVRGQSSDDCLLVIEKAQLALTPFGVPDVCFAPKSYLSNGMNHMAFAKLLRAFPDFDEPDRVELLLLIGIKQWSSHYLMRFPLTRRKKIMQAIPVNRLMPKAKERYSIRLATADTIPQDGALTVQQGSDEEQQPAGVASGKPGCACFMKNFNNDATSGPLLFAFGCKLKAGPSQFTF